MSVNAPPDLTKLLDEELVQLRARLDGEMRRRRIAACQQETPDVPHAHASEAERAVIERGPTSDIAPPPPERLPPGHAEFDFMPAPST